MIFGDDVGDPDPPAGSQDPTHLGQYGRLVDRQVDHAVGDHHVDAVVHEGDVLDGALAKLDVGDIGPGLVGFGSREHLVGHANAVDESVRSYPAGRKQHVDPPSGAQIEYAVALVQVGDGGRVSATQACRHGFDG